MKINEFLSEINMLPEAVHLLNELQESGRIGEEEYQENKLLYEKDRALFYEKILLEKDYRLVFLYYLCRMGAETYDAYEKRGISREIFRDTFYDLTFWCENCFLEYGEYGIDEYDWFFRHMKLTIFRLGRMQFEIMDSRWNFTAGERMVKKRRSDHQYSYSTGRKAHTGECEGIHYSGNGFLGKRDAVSVSFLAALSGA